MKIDKAETRKTFIQLLKYGVIGVVNTLITLVTFYVLNTLAGAPYGLANVVGYILGVINSFVWNRNWVFKTKDNWRREAMLFGVGFLLCLTLQLIVSWILLEGLGWKNMEPISWLPMQKTGQNVVMVIAMVVYTLANYIYNRLVTFNHKS
ncbi:MAG: GtrA family protein [Bacteroidales bacterium]|nr:GtrA family protein [Candidatus Sodaliphilus aphodohippi]